MRRDKLRRCRRRGCSGAGLPHSALTCALRLGGSDIALAMPRASERRFFSATLTAASIAFFVSVKKTSQMPKKASVGRGFSASMLNQEHKPTYSACSRSQLTLASSKLPRHAVNCSLRSFRGPSSSSAQPSMRCTYPSACFSKPEISSRSSPTLCFLAACTLSNSAPCEYICANSPGQLLSISRTMKSRRVPSCDAFSFPSLGRVSMSKPSARPRDVPPFK
mmetsp:Transcript_86576/g.242526  ORF Transcript_86576/g.242526 Transcript_86576/m.242526 type:complete len:221 (+) Transcript_86576:303-965(+)